MQYDCLDIVERLPTFANDCVVKSLKRKKARLNYNHIKVFASMVYSRNKGSQYIQTAYHWSTPGNASDTCPPLCSQQHITLWANLQPTPSTFRAKYNDIRKSFWIYWIWGLILKLSLCLCPWNRIWFGLICAFVCHHISCLFFGCDQMSFLVKERPWTTWPLSGVVFQMFFWRL